MMCRRKSACLCFCLLVVWILTFTSTVSGKLKHRDDSEAKPINVSVNKLLSLVQAQQVKEETQFVPFINFYRQRGAFATYMGGNFQGDVEEEVARRLFQVFDSTAYTTSYVLTILLEAFSSAGGPRPLERDLILAIDSFRSYVDKNRPYDNSILSFWPLRFESSKESWLAYPTNIKRCDELMSSLPETFVAQMLKKVGLNYLSSFVIYHAKNSKEDRYLLLSPPDQDTSITHLAFGASLKRVRDYFPDAWSLWAAMNQNKTSVFDLFKTYAYRPFSQETDSNSIDPRSYFYLRHFLDEAKATGSDVALITTWALTLSEQSEQYEHGAFMARGVNNVCLGVTANSVLGITRSVLSGVVNISILENDPLIQQIYLNSSNLLAYQIDSNLTGRPDLAALYYPTRVQLEWMISWTVAELEAAIRSGQELPPVMTTVHQRLHRSLRTSVTSRLLFDHRVEQGGLIYFQDFLSTHDLSRSTGEDRIFCTSLAVNTLINAWTYPRTSGHKKLWDASTPPEIVDTVARATSWLLKNSLNGRFKPSGAVFSSSFKWSRTLPYRYPANVYQFLNGTRIRRPWSSYLPDHLTSYMVRGYIPPAEYEIMLRDDYFGQPVPLSFHGYNADNEGFMWYWESEAFTYALTLLAVSNFNSID